MHRHELERHIAAARTGDRSPLSTHRSPERFDPLAARWLASWYPEKLGSELPACECRSGRCPICN